MTMTQREKKIQIIEEARRLGIADERAIRNIAIRDEFYEIRKAKTKSLKDTIKYLADKYFVSPAAINSVIYKKYIRKI